MCANIAQSMIGRSRRVSSLSPSTISLPKGSLRSPPLAMDDESSDILGQQTKPVLRGNKNDDWFGVSLTVKLAFGLAILLVLYVAVMRIWFRILVWRERSYKLCDQLLYLS